MIETSTNYYSASDLTTFKFAIEKKLDRAERQLTALDLQIWEVREHKLNQLDLVDNSSTSNDLDMLETMAIRQRKYILDLKHALQRIHTKSYGICIVTGELIDRKRLLAVPTSIMSLEGKIIAAEL